jgi:Flagellar assembly protein T, C-terminal domain
MSSKLSHLIVILGLTATLAHAQRAANTPTEADMYCSGVITTQAVPQDNYVISGVESDEHIIYHPGNLVFINKGAKQGVRVGDQFLVSRPESDQEMKSPWIADQGSLTKEMGTTYADIGRLRVASVQENTSTAEIVQSCDYVQRGDLVQPFMERPAPQYKAAAKFDPFAPPSSKAKAIVAATFRFGMSAGAGRIVYVNIGAAKGVQVGNYFRVFRYQDGHHNEVFELPKTAYTEFGLGSAPKAYTGADLPRDVLGEGIVLRVGPNAATVLLTDSLRDIYVGDNVELE